MEVIKVILMLFIVCGVGYLIYCFGHYKGQLCRLDYTEKLLDDAEELLKRSAKTANDTIDNYLKLLDIVKNNVDKETYMKISIKLHEDSEGVRE